MENLEIKLVKMVNNEGRVAEVHPNEVLNYATGGYVTCESLLGNTELPTPVSSETDLVSKPTLLIEVPQEIAMQVPEEALTGTNPNEPSIVNPETQVVLGEVISIVSGSAE